MTDLVKNSVFQGQKFRVKKVWFTVWVWSGFSISHLIFTLR